MEHKLAEQHDSEIFKLNEEILHLRKIIDEEQSGAKDHENYLNMKLTEIKNLHQDLDNLKEVINQKDEEITKLKTGLDALAQVSDDLNSKFIETSKELNKKNLMYDRLVAVYEIAKA